MRKFVVGLLCGAALTVAATATASQTVETVMSRAKLVFHINGKEQQLDTGVALFTYKGTTYVPIRLFSEKTGATIDYFPRANDGTPQIDISYADQSQFTVFDSSNSIGLGQVEVDFGDQADLNNKKPTIRGMVKLLKPIDKNKAVVLEVLDKNGTVVAQSELLKAGGWSPLADDGKKSLSEFQAGETRPFTTFIPFIPPIQDYEIAVKLVDSAAWMFKQDAPYAQQEQPFDVGISTNVDLSQPIKQNSKVTFEVHIMNTTPRELKILRAQLQVVVVNQKGATVSTLQTDPLEQVTIPGHNGSMIYKLPWDGTFPKGVYGVELKMPATIEYEDNGTAMNIGASGLNARFPITIK